MDTKRRLIGHRLRKARKDMGFTQSQVMKALGLRSDNRISQWENGNRVPSIKNLFKLSILYKRLPDEMFYEIREESKKSVELFLKTFNTYGENNARDHPR